MKLTPIWAILIAEGIFILALIPIPFVSPILAIAFLAYYFSYKKDVKNYGRNCRGVSYWNTHECFLYSFLGTGSDHIGLIMWGLLAIGGFVGGYFLFSFASKSVKRR